MSHRRTKKKKIISAAILFTSAYISVLFTLGMVLSYLVAKYVYEKLILKRNLSHLSDIKIGRWNFHLHHWISAGLAMLFIFMGSWQIESHKFLAGVISGIIVHDIYDFNDWHRVIYKDRKVA